MKTHQLSSCAGAALALLFATATAAAGPASRAAESVTQAAASQLGDLSAFRAIAADTRTIASHSEFAKARQRIKDLELAWDGAEAGLKPRAAAQWHVVDRAIDQALSAVRASQPDAAEVMRSLDALLAAFDAADPRPRRPAAAAAARMT